MYDPLLEYTDSEKCQIVSAFFQFMDMEFRDNVTHKNEELYNKWKEIKPTIKQHITKYWHLPLPAKRGEFTSREKPKQKFTFDSLDDVLTFIRKQDAQTKA